MRMSSPQNAGKVKLGARQDWVWSALFQTTTSRASRLRGCPGILLLGYDEILDLFRRQPGLGRNAPGKLGGGGARSPYRPV